MDAMMILDTDVFINTAHPRSTHPHRGTSLRVLSALWKDKNARVADGR
jgi:hypothetical protein